MDEAAEEEKTAGNSRLAPVEPNAVRARATYHRSRTKKDQMQLAVGRKAHIVSRTLRFDFSIKLAYILLRERARSADLEIYDVNGARAQARNASGAMLLDGNVSSRD